MKLYLSRYLKNKKCSYKYNILMISDDTELQIYEKQTNLKPQQNETQSVGSVLIVFSHFVNYVWIQSVISIFNKIK